MSQIRLYVDEDAAAFALVEALRHRGVDVVTVLDAGMASATDEQQLVIATSQGRAIYSHNVGDFCRLHREFLVQSRQHAGIILISPPTEFDRREATATSATYRHNHG